MRSVLLVLIVAVVAILIAVATGFLNINQIRGGEAPDVAATQEGIRVQGGQPPAFDVETGSVKVGTKDATIKTPTLEVEPPQSQAGPSANNAM